VSDEIDLLIQKKEVELLPLCTFMEELKQEFILETIDFASKWYKKTAKDYVAKYPEIALRMSEEKILKMKTKINQLVGDTEKIVKDELDNSALWWHKMPRHNDSIEQYTQLVDKYPQILDRAVRHVLGRLGIILEEFGFNVDASGNPSSFHEFWFERLPNTEKIIQIYPHLLKWTAKMEETTRKYNEQYTQAVTLYTEIQKLKKEKIKQQALTRWDSI
jgi:hypothetical protein